jgi:hypothetical protein
MIRGLHLLVFTPITPGGLRPETVASIVGQQTRQRVDWEIGRCNPHPGRDMRNVLAQYNYGRELCLSGPYDALLTVEQDMVIPSHTIEALCDTPAPVVYGTYLLRHNDPVLNAWQYIGNKALGMSLDRYPAELAGYRKGGVGRVSGVGFGCTLIRRSALEAIPFRQDMGDHAPDMPFAFDCVRQGITQLARFDVRCGHYHEGAILDIDMAAATVTVTVLQPVNILLGGRGVALTVGMQVELPPKQAQTLAGLGYVCPVRVMPSPQAQKKAAK